MEKHKINYRVQDLCNITKGWYSEYKKNSWESTGKKKANNPLENWARHTLHKKMSKWLITIWKGAQLHQLSGKCKLEPNVNTTTHLLEWLKWTRQSGQGYGTTADRNVNCYNPVILLGNMNLYSPKDLCNNVHCSITCNSPKI